MARIRYIGSKARIASAILDLVGKPSDTGGRFVDLFSGTGIVSRTAALLGWRILANDHLESSALITEAGLLSKNEVPFRHHGGYSAAISELNSAKSREGFIFDEYAPTGRSRSGDKRLYFTPENAARIDGLRQCISEWQQLGLVSKRESSLLIADLLLAANQVANTAGTYGCFLSTWMKSALQPLTLVPRELLPKTCDYEVTAADVFSVVCKPDDVIYLDPPYTKRQYAAYYHILETIAVGDSPRVLGKTGLRSWSEKSSPFCFKRKALGALMQLAQQVEAQRLVLSYSSDGHLDIADLQQAFELIGSVSVVTLGDIGRYRPNGTASEKADSVTEYLIDVTRNNTPAERCTNPARLAA